MQRSVLFGCCLVLLGLLTISVGLGGYSGADDPTTKIHMTINDVLNAFGFDVLDASVEDGVHGFFLYEPATGESFALFGNADCGVCVDPDRLDCQAETMTATLSNLEGTIEIAIIEDSWELWDRTDSGSEIGATLSLGGEVVEGGRLLIVREERVVGDGLTLESAPDYLASVAVGASVSFVGSSLVVLGESEIETEYTLTVTVLDEDYLLWEFDELVADQQSLTARQEISEWLTERSVEDQDTILELLGMRWDLTAYGYDGASGETLSETTSYILIDDWREYSETENGSLVESWTYLTNEETGSLMTIQESTEVDFETPVQWTYFDRQVFLDDVLYDAESFTRAVDPLQEYSLRDLAGAAKYRTKRSEFIAGIIAGLVQAEMCSKDQNCDCEELKPLNKEASQIVIGELIKEQLRITKSIPDQKTLAELIQTCLGQLGGKSIQEDLRNALVNPISGDAPCSQPETYADNLSSLLKSTLDALLVSSSDKGTPSQGKIPDPLEIREASKQQKKSLLQTIKETVRSRLRAAFGAYYGTTTYASLQALQQTNPNLQDPGLLNEAMLAKKLAKGTNLSIGSLFMQVMGERQKILKDLMISQLQESQYKNRMLKLQDKKQGILQSAIEAHRKRGEQQRYLVTSSDRGSATSMFFNGAKETLLDIVTFPMSLFDSLLGAFVRVKVTPAIQCVSDPKHPPLVDLWPLMLESLLKKIEEQQPQGSCNCDPKDVWSCRTQESLKELASCNDITSQPISNPGSQGVNWNVPRGTLSESPATISVSDASATEGEALVFTITRSGCLSGTSSVEYRTRDGSASSRTDYTSESGTLQFADGERSKTVSVPTFCEFHNEGREDLRLVLSNPTGAQLGDDSADGTISDCDMKG